MARIRTIKPEFQQSESMGRVSRDARLLFVQLWTFADDSGRARAASRMLASVLFPFDDDAPDLIDGWLSELEDEKCIIRYVIDGSSYLQVVNWEKHQKIDHPSPSKIPPSPDKSEIVATARESIDKILEPSRSLAPDLVPSTLDLVPKTRERELPLDMPSRAISKRSAVDERFTRFWAAWPNKVQRPYAEKCFARVAKEVDAIVAGVERYVATKPPDRPWLNPSTFLNQRRWEDALPPRSGPSAGNKPKSPFGAVESFQD
jgi:hypothetical protein